MISPNRQALQFLANDVQMARQQLKSIEEQIESLSAQRVAVQYRLEALEEKLSEISGGKTDDIPVPQSGESKIEGFAPTVSISSEIGVREAIRATLRAMHPQPLNAKTIAGNLPKAGLRYAAKVPLIARVRSELARMADEKQLIKRGKDYMLAAEWVQHDP